MVCQAKNCKLCCIKPQEFWQHRMTCHPELINRKPAKNGDEKDFCIFCCRKFANFSQIFKHVHTMHDPCCPCCNYVDYEKSGKPCHYHTWDLVKKRGLEIVRCSAWGCETHFNSFTEFWVHRLTFHAKIMTNVSKRSLEMSRNQLIRKKALASYVIKLRKIKVCARKTLLCFKFINFDRIKMMQFVKHFIKKTSRSARFGEESENLPVSVRLALNVEDIVYIQITH